MSGQHDQARVLLAELVECTSARGNSYLRGWLGASNVVGFAGEPDEQGRHTWKLYLVERQPKPNGAAPRAQGNSHRSGGDRYRAPRRESEHARQQRVGGEIAEEYGAAGDRPFDDQIPF